MGCSIPFLPCRCSSNRPCRPCPFRSPFLPFLRMGPRHHDTYHRQVHIVRPYFPCLPCLRSNLRSLLRSRILHLYLPCHRSRLRGSWVPDKKAWAWENSIRPFRPFLLFLRSIQQGIAVGRLGKMAEVSSIHPFRPFLLFLRSNLRSSTVG